MKCGNFLWSANATINEDASRKTRRIKRVPGRRHAHSDAYHVLFDIASRVRRPRPRAHSTCRALPCQHPTVLALGLVAVDVPRHVCDIRCCVLLVVSHATHSVVLAHMQGRIRSTLCQPSQGQDVRAGFRSLELPASGIVAHRDQLQLRLDLGMAQHAVVVVGVYRAAWR